MRVAPRRRSSFHKTPEISKMAVCHSNQGFGSRSSLTCGGAAGHGRPEDALVGGEVDLDRRVAPRVVDHPRVDLADRHGASGALLLREGEA